MVDICAAACALGDGHGDYLSAQLLCCKLPSLNVAACHDDSRTSICQDPNRFQANAWNSNRQTELALFDLDVLCCVDLRT